MTVHCPFTFFLFNYIFCKRTINMASRTFRDVIELYFIVMVAKPADRTDPCLCHHVPDGPKVLSAAALLEEVGENCIMRSCMICTLLPVLLG
jgi:hypothetical protein